MKTYIRRDSATSKLRKLGMPKEQYNRYITNVDGGRVYLNLEAAERSLIKADVEAAREETKPEVTISAFCKRLILAGHSNQQVYKALLETFGDPDEKRRQYPSWYRSQLRKQGKLS